MNEDDICALFGRNIKRFRKRYEWSQDNLAERLDISTNFLCNIENGKAWVSPATLAKLSVALNISVHELFMQETALPKDTQMVMEKYTQEIRTSLHHQLSKTLNRSLDDIYRSYTECENGTVTGG
jgi:transcriptional regulator with XRE-family HTH domain